MDGKRGRRCRGLAALTFAVVGLGHVFPAAARERDLVLGPGPFSLADAAAKALRSWTYRPALLDGKPVPVCSHLVISFDVQ